MANVRKLFACPNFSGGFRGENVPLKPQNHLRCLTINPFRPLHTCRPRAGFCNIVGSPNVGKSTLMNRLVGERLSIINAKAQTTRHRIMGIVNKDDYQIVYSDTPGVLDPAYKLQEGMMKFVKTALKMQTLVVTEVNEKGMAHPETLEKIQRWMSRRLSSSTKSTCQRTKRRSKPSSTSGPSLYPCLGRAHQCIAQFQRGHPARAHRCPAA